jgi:hypothetical protein
VQGTWLATKSGKPVVLRGIWSEGHYQFSSSFPTQVMMQEIKAAGANYFRIGSILWNEFEPQQGTFNQASLSVLDNVAGWCKDQKIYFSFDFGNFLGSDLNTPFSAPDWLTGTSKDPSTFEVNFFDRSQAEYEPARAEFAKMLVMLSNRYKDNPYVMLSVMNEPYNGNKISSSGSPDATTRSAQYADTMGWFYDQIVSTGYQGVARINHPWVNYGISDPTPVERPQLIWEGHGYIVQGSSDFAKWHDKYIQDYLYQPYVVQMKRPLIVGEWAVLNPSFISTHDTPGWLEDTQQMIKSLNADFGVAGAAWDSLPNLYVKVGNMDPYTAAEKEQIYSTIFQGAVGP